MRPKNKNSVYYSRFKGVSSRGNGTYTAQIVVNKSLIYLGCFQDEVEAAKAYDKAAIKIGKQNNNFFKKI